MASQTLARQTVRTLDRAGFAIIGTAAVRTFATSTGPRRIIVKRAARGWDVIDGRTATRAPSVVQAVADACHLVGQPLHPSRVIVTRG